MKKEYEIREQLEILNKRLVGLTTDVFLAHAKINKCGTEIKVIEWVLDSVTNSQTESKDKK